MANAPSFAAASAQAGQAGKIYSQAIRDTEVDRKAEARKAKWDNDNSGEVSEEEAYVAEMALLTRQKAILDIILLVRDKIRQFSASAYATRELKKVFMKFDPDGSNSISWYEFDKALKEMGVNISLAELEHLMEIFDTDGDGELHWGEFVDWVDDRVPLTLEKMRKIISAHEGNAAKRGSKFAAVKGPSPAYMKEWLKVHGENVSENIAAIAKPNEAHSTMSPLGGNVKLLGDSKKVEQALKKRKASRAEVIEGLRVAVMSKAAADVPLKQQLDMVWARFDVNGDGIINWKEFASGMKSMGMEFSPQELSAIMKEFDTNCDGALDYVEFVGHLLPTTSTTVEEDFDRLTAARRSMLQVRGISRAGVPNTTMKK